MNKTEYKEYLQSEHWKSLRRQKLDESNYKCSKCGSAYMLQVHHLNYRSILDVTTSDLVVLCDYCHKKEHGIKSSGRPIKPDTKKLLEGGFHVPIKKPLTLPWNPNKMTQEQIRQRIKDNKSKRGQHSILIREKKNWDKAMNRETS